MNYRKTKLIAWLHWRENGKRKTSMRRVWVDEFGNFFVRHNHLWRLVELLQMQGYEVRMYEL